jgi:hypothetical protein
VKSYDKIEDLLGEIIVAVLVSGDEDQVILKLKGGARVAFYHSRDCCEEVYLESVSGNLGNLIGRPITKATEVSNRDHQEELDTREESFTWTFYELGTGWGTVTFRWFGTSNGYYAEDVSMRQLEATTSVN